MSNHFNSSIQCLSLIARFHQIPAEPNALIPEFQHNVELLADINLICAAKSLGFKAKFIQDKADRLSAHTLPAIACHQDDHFFIIAKITSDEVLIHDIANTNQNNKPTSDSFDSFDFLYCIFQVMIIIKAIS